MPARKSPDRSELTHQVMVRLSAADHAALSRPPERRKDKASRHRPNTRSAYSASLKHLRAHFQRARLDQIDVTAVARFVAAQQASGLKGWTVRGQLVVMNRIFDHASRHLGWHGQNPVRQLDPDERPKVDERDKRILTADELAKLIESVEDRHRLIFQFAGATGGRLGEVLGVRWHGLDFDAGTVHFSHQLTGTATT